MKDAKGHGSDGRGGFGKRDFGVPIKTAGMRGVNIALNASFRPRYSDAAATVDALRSQMRNTGPGHKTGLLQGIKNILGG